MPKKKAKKVSPQRKSKKLPLIICSVAGMLIAVALIVLFGNSPEEVPSSTSRNRKLAGFAGSDACARCHQKEYDAWKGSTHAKAGGLPGEVEVIAKFDGTPLRFKDAIVTPIKKGSNYIFKVQQHGLPDSEIKVDAIVGGGHMFGGGTQSFFQKFADGTIRFLPFDFIRKENLWFVQLRKDSTWVPVSSEISLQSDLANWPPHRVLGTLAEMSNCQNCHGSQIAVNYNTEKFSYETHFTSLAINCESCHGPGKAHIEITSKPGWESKEDIGMAALATLGKDQSLNVCFQCHAEKKQLTSEQYLPGDNLEEHFSLKFPVIDGAFHVDGRVRKFGYQSSHLYSDCYINGSMTCVDCHDPHGQGYRDIFGTELAGRFDDRQCTSCHASKTIDPEKHSHHKPGTSGSLCTDCHMPFLQHQGVGPHLKFARSDHAIPIPRPAFDESIGVENACQKCHGDKTLEWQEAKVRELWGKIKPHNAVVANVIKAQTEDMEATAARNLLLQSKAVHPMAQIAALGNYIQKHVFPLPGDLDAATEGVLSNYMTSLDVDLKALAFTTLKLKGSGNYTLSGTNELAVRNRWSLLADEFGSAYAAGGNYPEAVEAFTSSLEANSSNEVAMSHLALTHLRAGDIDKAIHWLQEAIRVKPYQAVLHFQLAQTYAHIQDMPRAITSLEQGLKYAPTDAKARALLESLKSQQLTR